MLRGLAFCQFLRTPKEFSPAMAASVRFDEGSGTPPRSSFFDPSTTSFWRAQRRLDILDMLLERRRFAAARLLDLIVYIGLFSDSSPVTGEELQGMVMDIIYTDESHRRLVLPGATLAYNCTSAVFKSIALLWSCWLVAGPSYAAMSYFYSKVRCITTDGGTEKSTIELPDVLRAFLKWVSGTPLLECRGLVIHDRRLMFHCLRVSGWCHAWGNTMKAMAGMCPCWPRVLSQMRTLVAFWRNQSYRAWVKRALRGTPEVDGTIFDHFRATFAKWRYETIALGMRVLLIYREVHEVHLQPWMFQQAQDKNFINEVMAASKDKNLWVFLASTDRHCMWDCELSRRWGLTCLCDDHVRRRHDGEKHIECFWNSRKLHVAEKFCTDEKTKVRALGESMTPAMCEGHRDIYELMVVMLHKKMTEIDQRFGYLGKVPWLFSRMDEVDGAVEIIRQCTAVDLSKHDPLTRIVMARLGGDILARSCGEPATPQLKAEAKIFRYSSLDESCGEGYHAKTHLEKTRAPASTAIHLKQSTRHRPALARAEDVVNTYGPAGEAVLRCDWRDWKRIVQTSAKRPWDPVDWTAQKVIDRVYRQDEMAQEDFSQICQRIGPDRPVQRDTISSSDAVRNEYLHVVLTPGHHYSVGAVPRDAAAEGPARCRWRASAGC